MKAVSEKLGLSKVVHMELILPKEIQEGYMVKGGLLFEKKVIKPETPTQEEVSIWVQKKVHNKPVHIHFTNTN